MSWLRHPLNRLSERTSRSRGRHVATAVDGLSYVVDVDDDGPGRAILRHGATPELRILPLALQILAANGTPASRGWFVDVGANIGTTVIPALAFNGFARGIAIEPEPDNVRVLRANVALNDLGDRIEVIAAAAGDAPGIAGFRRGKQTRHGWRAGAGAVATTGDMTETIPVEVVALDRVLADRGIAPSEVGLLWLDVQGYEGHVLMGAAGLMEGRTPLVFALRPGKLEKAGTLDFLTDAIAATYPFVVDLRAQGGPAVRPGAELAAIMSGRQTTDVLAFDPGARSSSTTAGTSARVASS